MLSAARLAVEPRRNYQIIELSNPFDHFALRACHAAESWRGGRLTVDPWAPLEGRLFNLGVRYAF